MCDGLGEARRLQRQPCRPKMAGWRYMSVEAGCVLGEIYSLAEKWEDGGWTCVQKSAGCGSCTAVMHDSGDALEQSFCTCC